MRTIINAEVCLFPSPWVLLLESHHQPRADYWLRRDISRVLAAGHKVDFSHGWPYLGINPELVKLWKN